MSDESPAEAPVTAAPTRRKKKRKAARRADRGGDLPAFARSFPVDSKLDRLVSAFERGDYASVREGSRKLAHETDNETVRRAARELVRRTEPDPLSQYLLAIGFGLLVFLSFWYWSHPHPGP